MNKDLLIFTVVFVLIGGYAWRHHSLVEKLAGNVYFSDQASIDNRAAAVLTHEQYLALGWVEEWIDNLSFYPNHPFKKKPGMVRIGIFGGSHAVCGGGTKEKDFTYPGLLQEKFKAQGFDQVEVINFGARSYGMSQEYMLWEFLGQKYDLDYAVFTIQDNAKYRDTTFMDGGKDHFILHGRYIIDHGELRFIPLAGDSMQNAYKFYFRGIPPLRYLLYDKKIPFGLKMFLPESLYSRVNPFYYKHDIDEGQETFPLYAKMLEKVAQRTKHVIIVANEEDGALSKMMKVPNIHVFITPSRPSEFQTPGREVFSKQFPYYEEDHAHSGPLGNALIADMFFSYLTGQNTWKDVAFHIQPRASLNKAQGSGITGDISDYESFNIQTGNNTVAHLVNVNLEKFSKGSEGNKSFLMLPSVDDLFNVFLLLPFDLQEGQKVFFSFHSTEGNKSLLIGTVHADNKIIGVLEPVKCKFRSEYDWNSLKIRTSLILEDKDPTQGVIDGDLTINDSKVLGVKTSVLQEDKLVFLASDDSYFFNGNPFDPKGGTLDLVVTKNNKEQQRCPIFSYEMAPFSTKIQDPYQDLMQALDKPEALLIK